MKLYIKNMVCSRCIMAVNNVLSGLKFKSLQVELGEVKLAEKLTDKQLLLLTEKLNAIGFEILDDRHTQLIEKIKTTLINLIQSENIEEHFSLTDYLPGLLYKDYSYVSRLFSEVEGITIEQFFILQKIEKVKELLTYGELNLSEIAWKLGYSSVQHLSAQFKKITGFAPTQMKSFNTNQRKPLDKVK